MGREGLQIGGLWAEIGLDTTPLSAGEVQVKAIVQNLDAAFGSVKDEVAGLNTELASLSAKSAIRGLSSSMKTEADLLKGVLIGSGAEFVDVQGMMAASAQKAAQDAERAIVEAEARKAAAIKNTIGVMRSAAAAFGIYLGAQQAVQFARGSVQTATESARVYNRLGNQLGLLTGSYRENLGALWTWFDGMQTAALFMKDQLADVFQDLLLDTGDYNKALKDLPLAMDLAAAKGIPLASAADAIAKAEAGVTRQLTMLIPQLRGSLDPLGDLRKLVGGSAAKDMDNYAGKVHLLSVHANEFKEAFGSDLISNLTPFVDLMERLANIGKTDISDKSIFGTAFREYVKYMTGGGLPGLVLRQGVKFGTEGMEWSGIGNKPKAVAPPSGAPGDQWADYYLADEARTQYGMDTEPLDYAKRKAAREGLFAEGIGSLKEMESTTESLHSAIAEGWKDMLSSARGSEAELDRIWSRYADAQKDAIRDREQADLEMGMSGADAHAFAAKKLADLDAEHGAFVRNSAAIDAQVALYKDLATSGLLSASDLKEAWANLTAQRIRQINDEAAAFAKTLRTDENDPRVISFKNIGISKAMNEQTQYYAGLKDSVAGGLRDVLQANNLSKEKLQALWTDYEDLRIEQIDAEVDRQVKAAAAAGRILNPAFLRESMGKNLAEEKLDLVGTELEKWTAGTGKRMRETFSEFFFDAQKGDWQSWQSYVESVFDSLMRAISDNLGDMVVEWISSMAKMKASTTSGWFGELLNILGGGAGGAGGGGGGLGDFPIEVDAPFAASGGITKGPTIAGEAGPEAIIPLSKFQDPAFMEAITGRAARSEKGEIKIVMHVHGVQDARSFQESESQILGTMYRRMAAAEARNG